MINLLSKYKWEVLPHAPYSPDLSPPDFDLFHELRAHVWTSCSLPGRGFCSSYLSHPRTEKSGTLNGIVNLLKRWDAVIEKQGDYIEGL